MRVAVTGHRPGKLFKSFPYAPENYRKLVDFCREKLVKPAKRKYPDVVFITGMALGLDMAIAEACQEVGVPFEAYVPFEGQEQKWPHHAQAQYTFLLACAKTIVICDSPGYSVAKLLARNTRMVDDTDMVVSLWNGEESGTGHCVAYARKHSKFAKNYWEEWLEYRDA